MVETAPHEQPSRELDRRNGSFRSVVTSLEMTRPPEGPAGPPPYPDVTLIEWNEPDIDTYLELFHRVGDPWLWYGRLTAARAEIAELIRSPAHAVWRLWRGSEVAGLCELDRSRPGEVEIAYFGLVPAHIGTGLGGHFLRSMVREAWRGPVSRVWLHTCTEDHPAALEVYQRAGFRPIGSAVEWVRDPRLRGLLPRTAGPHVPIPE